LVALQQPLSQPQHHDEMLFIIIHQVYELWFKQVLHELKAAMTAMDADDLLRVHKIFRRVHTIQRLLEQQVDILETMTPQEFNQFRDNLNPASGFQSIQIREIEFVSGLRRMELLSHIEMTPEQRARFESYSKEPTLYDRAKELIRRRGFAVDTPEQVVESFRLIYTYEQQYNDLHLLLEDLIEFDERLVLWRSRHVRMVERMIGRKRGTGGSSGAEYLEKTLAYRLFPELWEVRTVLGQGINYG
jgi:tryptophan 2,3-dioxygenase